MPELAAGVAYHHEPVGGNPSPIHAGDPPNPGSDYAVRLIASLITGGNNRLVNGLISRAQANPHDCFQSCNC